jgi:hypothetical protein
MEWDYETDREVFEWTLRNQPNEVLQDLDIDKALADKLRDALDTEVAALAPIASDSPVQLAAKLNKAKALSELMGWTPPQSTAGQWRAIIGQNFTDFTGFLQVGRIQWDFDVQLENIRTNLTSHAPAAGTHLYIALDAIAQQNASSNPSLSNKAVGYKNGTSGATIDTILADTLFKDRADIVGALQNDYITD